MADEFKRKNDFEKKEDKPQKEELRGKLLSEIIDKVELYQTRNAAFLNEYNDWSDMFTIKKPQRKSNTFSNPRLSEMFRAANALSTMEYRMLTNQEPFFEFLTDEVGQARPDSAYKAQQLIITQLEKSKYKENLFRSLLMRNVFGTVVVEEPFDTMILSHLGRKLPMLKFVPRSLLQVFFDPSTSDISEGQWIATSDMVSTYYLQNQKSSDSHGGWVNSELNKALAKDAESPELDQYIKSRLQASGYTNTDEWPANIREFITYYGKLECLNDGLEYVVGIVNRKYIVKFTDNPLQTGKRPFRIAHYLKWELEPLGYGLGKLFSSLHKSMDANRQRMQDTMAFASYNPMLRNRYAGISDKDMVIKPWAIIDTDDVNALQPLKLNSDSVQYAMTIEKLMQEEFRAASGATNTLQAIITEATASEVSLAQNEAVRNISVKAELAAESLMREHIEMMHTYNMLFIKDKLKVMLPNGPVDIYPDDLLLDLDVKLKIVTDKDFKPERLKKLLEYYSTLTSIRNVSPDMAYLDTKPLVRAINKAMDIPGDVIVALTPERVQELQLAAQLMNQLRGTANGNPQEQAMQSEGMTMSPSAPGPQMGQGGEGVVGTPIGPVLGSQNEGVY